MGRCKFATCNAKKVDLTCSMCGGTICTKHYKECDEDGCGMGYCSEGETGCAHEHTFVCRVCRKRLCNEHTEESSTRQDGRVTYATCTKCSTTRAEQEAEQARSREETLIALKMQPTAIATADFEYSKERLEGPPFANITKRREHYLESIEKCWVTDDTSTPIPLTGTCSPSKWKLPSASTLDETLESGNGVRYTELACMLLEYLFLQTVGQWICGGSYQGTLGACVLRLTKDEKTHVHEAWILTNGSTASSDPRKPYVPKPPEGASKDILESLGHIQIRVWTRKLGPTSYGITNKNDNHFEMQCLQLLRDRIQDTKEKWELVAIAPSKGCCPFCHEWLSQNKLLHLIPKHKRRENLYRAWAESSQHSCVRRWIEQDTDGRHHLMEWNLQDGRLGDLGCSSAEDGTFHVHSDLEPLDAPASSAVGPSLQVLRSTREDETKKLKEERTADASSVQPSAKRRKLMKPPSTPP